MNIEDMRALVAVIEEGSLASAALRLGLTQPAVTRRLQNLEEQLDTQLLDRDQKPARPTRAGRRAYKACLQVLRATDDLKGTVDGSIGPESIRLGISLGISDAVVKPVFRALKKLNPAMTIDVITDRSIGVTRRLASGGLDAGLVVTQSGHHPDPRGKPVRLGNEQVDIVAAADSPLAKSARLQDVSGNSWIINPEGCGFRTQLENLLHANGLSMTVSASIWGVPQQLALIADGAGLGLIPRRARELPQWRKSTRAIEVRGFHANLDVWLIRGDPESWIDRPLNAIADTVSQILDAE